jgi:hypothetical protein
MTRPLSPAAQAIWEAFNADEAGVFIDYGDKLAAALRALADQPIMWMNKDRILAIAAELEGK